MKTKITKRENPKISYKFKAKNTLKAIVSFIDSLLSGNDDLNEKRKKVKTQKRNDDLLSKIVVFCAVAGL